MTSDRIDEMERRAFVVQGAVGAGVLGTVGGLGVFLLHDPETVTAQSPGPETWPLSRFGPRNAANDPLASPPADPDARSVATASDPRSLVAAGRGPEMRVLVGGPDSLRAHGSGGSEQWVADGRTVVGVRPLTSVGYAVGGGPLRSFDVRDGTVRWETDRENGAGVVPTQRGLLVPFDGGVAVYDRTGNEQFTIQGGTGASPASVAVFERLFAAGRRAVSRYRPRRLLRSLRGGPPAADWTVGTNLQSPRTVALGDRDVFVSDAGGGADGVDSGGILRLSRDGDTGWYRTLPATPGGFAVGDDRLFVATSASGSGPSPLFALEREDGATAWVDRRVASHTPPVLAGELVVVGAGLADGSGLVRALDRDGGAVWTVETSTPVVNVAPAAERVYAVTDGGRLYVLS